MHNKYFDKWEFLQAFSCVEDNPLEAKIKYEEYLEKYPRDYYTYTYYANILIILGELDKAEEVLNFVEKYSNIDSKIINRTEKIQHIKRNYVFAKLKLLSYQKKYNEFYRFYIDNYNQIQNIGLNEIVFYCKKKLGKLDLGKRQPNSYLFRQMVKYDENDFFEHIQKHLADYNANEDIRNCSIFVPDFPIYKVIEEIKKYIPSQTKLNHGFFDNMYVFKYDQCGRDKNKLVNYFKVICFNDTNEFITIFPSDGCENFPYIDLNYLNHNNCNENIKIKRKSQIEKFNQKYNIK